jgi:hypothetical protein
MGIKQLASASSWGAGRNVQALVTFLDGVAGAFSHALS